MWDVSGRIVTVVAVWTKGSNTLQAVCVCVIVFHSLLVTIPGMLLWGQGTVIIIVHSSIDVLYNSCNCYVVKVMVSPSRAR